MLVRGIRLWLGPPAGRPISMVRRARARRARGGQLGVDQPASRSSSARSTTRSRHPPRREAGWDMDTAHAGAHGGVASSDSPHRHHVARAGPDRPRHSQPSPDDARAQFHAGCLRGDRSRTLRRKFPRGCSSRSSRGRDEPAPRRPSSRPQSPPPRPVAHVWGISRETTPASGVGDRLGLGVGLALAGASRCLGVARSRRAGSARCASVSSRAARRSPTG